jgi:hypothetical protein
MSAVRRMFGIVVLILLSACVLLSACGEPKLRLAFEDHAYPAFVHVRVWFDDNETSQTVMAQCTDSGCRTEPLDIPRGRHRVRLQVVVGDGNASAITETTLER